MSITRNFDLRLNAGKSIPLTIHVSQYDQEQWVFTLYDDNGEQYVPSSGAIVGIKADNLGVIKTASVVGGNVVVEDTEQITAAAGKNVFELMIDDQTHGTANFVVMVEPKPGENADLSESDLSLIQQAIDSTSATAIAQGVADWMDDNLTPTTPVVDASLTVQGAAADSKKVGDEISELKSQINQLEAIPHAVKLAMDTLFQNVAMKDDAVYSDEYATFHAWATAINLLSISAVYTQSGTVYNTDSLDSLKNDLVVTASYDDGSSVAVTNYTLSGTLTEGTSTITVTYEDKTTSFNVTVTDDTPLYPLENGNWTSSNGNRSIVVTNGNHISYTNNAAATSGTGLYGNLSNCTSNGTAGTENTNFKHAQIFTIPANSEVEFSFTPTALSGLSAQDGNNIALYIANSTTVIGANTSAKFTTQTTIGEKITESFTVAEETNIGSISMYARNMFSRVEGDIELRVNGTRYI